MRRRNLVPLHLNGKLCLGSSCHCNYWLTLTRDAAYSRPSPPNDDSNALTTRSNRRLPRVAGKQNAVASEEVESEPEAESDVEIAEPPVPPSPTKSVIGEAISRVVAAAPQKEEVVQMVEKQSKAFYKEANNALVASRVVSMLHMYMNDITHQCC